MQEHIYIYGWLRHKTTLSFLSKTELLSAHITYCLPILLKRFTQYHNQLPTIKLLMLVFLVDCYVVLLESATQK